MSRRDLFPSIEELETEISCLLDRFYYLSSNGMLTLGSYQNAVSDYAKRIKGLPINSLLKSEWKSALLDANINSMEQKLVDEIKGVLREGAVLKLQDIKKC